jgi:hypothetical protein
MEKGLGFIVIILIWGGLIYFFFKTPVFSELSGSRFLGSSLASLNSALNEQRGIINVFGKNFQNATIHFSKKVDIFDIKVSPRNPELIFAGSNHGLFISRDGGMNWYNFSDVEHKIDSNTKIYKILFNSKSAPGGNSQSFISVFSSASGGNKGIVYKSQDKFFSLEKILELDNEAVYDFDIYGDNLYLGLSNGRLLLYSLKNNEVRLLTTLNSPITNLKVSQDAEGLIYLTLKSGGFWVSKNNGQSFDRREFLDDYRGADKINEFLAARLDKFLIYAATDYGLIRSLNAGETWQVFKSLPAEKPRISSLAIRENPGEIFVASNGKIYRSRDYGSNWQILEPEFNDREISVISLDNDRIIVGSKRN